MIQGPEPGSLYKLPDNRVTTIGRSSRNTIRTVSSSVSRFHCEVSCVNGQWELTDLNSKKGTMVNGERIEGRCALTRGDIVRVSTTVFRFDMMDETAAQDGAIVAIMEAELDQKLLTKGEAPGSLADIRARSRLESEEAREGRVSHGRKLKANLAFVCVIAVAVGIVVTSLLVYAYRRSAVPRQQRAFREEHARALYDEALVALRMGDRTMALRKLWDAATEYPGTQAAREAGRARAETFWPLAQEKLALVCGREADGDYAAALSLYEELRQLHPDRLLEELLAQRREYTVRLAHASYKATDQEGRQLAAAGNAKAAIGLYGRARDRIGLPELVAEAQARIAELEKGAP